MIKVALNGGLGNQLFQYAAGKALAIRNNTELCLDVIPLYSKLQWNKIATYRKYELDVFSLHAIKNEFRLKHRYLYPLAKTCYFLNKQLSKVRFHYFRERDFSFDEMVLSLPDNTYLDGHFQSENYFKEIEPVIRKELLFSVPLTGQNIDWKEKMQHSESVSIHIRRGDYLALQKNLDKHGITSSAYYQDAIDYMASKLQKPVFYIFTDDVKWVKENFRTHFSFCIIDKQPDSGFRSFRYAVNGFLPA